MFSVLSLFTDVYDFPLRPRWMTVIVTEPRPGMHLSPYYEGSGGEEGGEEDRDDGSFIPHPRPV